MSGLVRVGCGVRQRLAGGWGWVSGGAIPAEHLPPEVAFILNNTREVDADASIARHADGVALRRQRRDKHAQVPPTLRLREQDEAVVVLLDVVFSERVAVLKFPSREG